MNATPERLENAPGAREKEFRRRLAEHVGALRTVSCSLVVCVQALQHQAADMDVEIAAVIQRVAGDKLDETTDRLEALALGIEYQDN